MQLGQSQEAIETYQMSLTLDPALVDAHSNLGNLFKASGDLESAKRCYLEAVRIKPDFAIAWSNLAGVFKDEGQVNTAIAYYKEAVRLCPEFADAHSNLGNALKELHDVDEAIECYKTAITLRPDFAIAHGNIGVSYWEKGNVEEAIKCLKYAIQLEPNYPDAFNNLGNVYRQEERLEDAIQCYRSALRLKPDHPHAYNNLGNAMKDMGMIREAIHCYVTAIRLLPTYAAAHSNLGSVLKSQGKMNQAIAHFQEAISIDPLFAIAYSNLGNCYKETYHLEEAFKCYQTAIKIKPDYADAYSNLAGILKDSGNIKDAFSTYEKALTINANHTEAFFNLVHTKLHLCVWKDREIDFQKMSELLQKFSKKFFFDSTTIIQPFHSLAYPLSLAELKQISELQASEIMKNVALVETHFTFRPKPKSIRLKIGYVSSDFGNHPLSHLIQSIFGIHDRVSFEIYCYALNSPDGSTWRKKIEDEVEHFKDISQLHHGDAAQLIHNDGIHILINLNGYTRGCKNEIFALHPAPIQMQYLGFCGTMGSDFIEYIIADDVVIPRHKREFYTEKVLSLPHSYFVTDHRQSSDQILLPPDRDVLNRNKYGIPEDKFVFCNFNQLYKIDPQIFEVWMNLLKRVENSVLWLLRFPPEAEENINIEASRYGIKKDQIIFSDVCPHDEHIGRGYLADLFLDTPSYNAHTTAADILYVLNTDNTASSEDLCAFTCY